APHFGVPPLPFFHGGAQVAAPTPPAVTGTPLVLLRLEGLALLALAMLLYARSGASWRLFAVLFLAPDLSFAAYLAGSRVGAAVYNAAHTTLGAIVLGGIGVILDQPLAISLALIWAGHLGCDRMLGFGLKYEAGFGFTHLGRIGRAAL